MFAAGLHRRGDGQGLRSETSPQGMISATTGCPRVNGPGLVEGDGLQGTQVFQVQPPFDQHSAVGRISDGGNNGHRRGDHQGAGAGDDQQGEGVVDGGKPGCAEDRGGISAMPKANRMIAGV